MYLQNFLLVFESVPIVQWDNLKFAKYMSNHLLKTGKKKKIYYILSDNVLFERFALIEWVYTINSN